MRKALKHKLNNIDWVPKKSALTQRKTWIAVLSKEWTDQGWFLSKEKKVWVVSNRSWTRELTSAGSLEILNYSLNQIKAKEQS